MGGSISQQWWSNELTCESGWLFEMHLRAANFNRNWESRFAWSA
jgi:hypothetical protein